MSHKLLRLLGYNYVSIPFMLLTILFFSDGTRTTSNSSEVRMDVKETSRVWERYLSELTKLTMLLDHVKADGDFHYSLTTFTESAPPMQVKQQSSDLSCLLSDGKIKYTESFDVKMIAKVESHRSKGSIPARPEPINPQAGSPDAKPLKAQMKQRTSKGKEVFIENDGAASLATGRHGGKLRLSSRDTSGSYKSQLKEEDIKSLFLPQLTVDRLYLPQMIREKNFVLKSIMRSNSNSAPNQESVYKFNFEYRRPRGSDTVITGWWTVDPCNHWAINEFACEIKGKANGPKGTFQISNVMHGKTSYSSPNSQAPPIPTEFAYEHSNKISQSSNSYSGYTIAKRIEFRRYQLVKSEASEFDLASIGLGMNDRPETRVNHDLSSLFLIIAITTLTIAICLTWLRRRIGRNDSTATQS